MRRPSVIPPVHLVVAVAAMVSLHWLLPIRHWIDWPWRGVGLAPAVVALLIGVWAIWIFHQRGTTHRPGQTSRHLVTNGPFQFTRNPMYLGMTLLLTGVALLMGSTSPWAVIPLFVLVISAEVIPVEEAMLKERFGEEYEEYRGQVRRWV